MIRKPFSMLYRQFKSHRVPTIFLMIGFVISLLMISFGTTSYVHLKQIIENRNGNVPPHAISANISVNSTSFQFRQLLEAFNQTDPNTGIIFTDLSCYIDNADMNRRIPLRAELFHKKLNWGYILMEGRYYNEDEIKSGKSVVLAGKNLKPYLIREDNKDMLMVSGQKYQVIGWIGKEKESTSWDDTVVMPVYSLPEPVRASVETTGFVGAILYNEQSEPVKDAAILENRLHALYPGSQMLVEGIKKELDVISLALENPDFTYILSILVYVLALINSINLTSFWIHERRFEIGVRKAFGYSNRHIIFMLMAEMFTIILLCCIISILLHIGIHVLMGSMLGNRLEIHLDNVVVAVAFVILSTLITSIIPAIQSMRLQPVEALKK